MSATTISSGNCAGLTLAMIVFCVGVLITIAIPILGWILGPIICIGALFMGGKKSKVWRCGTCKFILPRA